MKNINSDLLAFPPNGIFLNSKAPFLKLCYDLLMASDTGTCFILFLFDLSATFDTVDHKVLLNKFKVLAGISSSTFDWFPFYLSTRTFSVRMKKLSLNITLWGSTMSRLLPDILFMSLTMAFSYICLSRLEAG